LNWADLEKMTKEETKFEKWFKKTIKGIAPIIITITFLIYVYLWVMEKYGFERPIISLLVIIVVILNNILKVLQSGPRK